jgi:hypothetical protein
MASNMAQAASCKQQGADGAAGGPRADILDAIFLEHPPFLDWVGELRSAGVRARVVGGLAGPIKLERSCHWLQAVADGRFRLDDEAGFRV